MTIEVEHTEIDERVTRNELNVLERELATRLVERALGELQQLDRIIADGKRMFLALCQRFDRLESHDRAEEKHAAVAAASVVAKVLPRPPLRPDPPALRAGARPDHRRRLRQRRHPPLGPRLLRALRPPPRRGAPLLAAPVCRRSDRRCLRASAPALADLSRYREPPLHGEGDRGARPSPASGATRGDHGLASARDQLPAVADGSGPAAWASGHPASATDQRPAITTVSNLDANPIGDLASATDQRPRSTGLVARAHGRCRRAAT